MDRRGFTLIEMLVVLGIMLVLLSLTATAFVRANRVDRLSATKDLVSDMVRQARATARSSGEPVRLVIEQAAGSSAWAVRGVTSTRLATLDFEDPPVEDTGNPLHVYRTSRGSTGQGFRVPSGSIPTDHVALTSRNRLRAGDGFVLAVDAWVPTTVTSGVIPLVLLGDSTIDADTSAAGLRLLRWTVPIFDPAHRPQVIGSPPTRWDPSSSAWMLQGWIRANGTPITVSAWWWPVDTAHDLWDANPTIDTRDTARLHLLRSDGPRWTRYGLAWDGTTLRLLLDGVPIAQRDASGTLATADTLHLGSTTFTTSWPPEANGSRPLDTIWDQNLAGTGGTAILPAGVVLDRMTLDRLGSGDPHPLPGGMTVKDQQPKSLLFWPQGTVTGHTTLEFSGVAEDADTGMTLTVSPTTGAITAETLDAAP